MTSRKRGRVQREEANQKCPVLVDKFPPGRDKTGGKNGKEDPFMESAERSYLFFYNLLQILHLADAALICYNAAINSTEHKGRFAPCEKEDLQ